DPANTGAADEVGTMRLKAADLDQLFGRNFLYARAWLCELIDTADAQTVERPVSVEVAHQSGVNEQFGLTAETAGDEKKWRFAAPVTPRHQQRICCGRGPAIEGVRAAVGFPLPTRHR